MLSLIESFLLGFFQGLTEFLPISSSGHLGLIQIFFSTDQIFLIIIVAHLGTLISLIFFYRSIVLDILKNILSSPKENLFLKIIIASLPTLLTGLSLYEIIRNNFHHLPFISLGFIFTGCLLLGTHWKIRQSKSLRKDLTQITYLQAFWIGCTQVLALIPGVSRSGTTISAGIYLGLHPFLSITFSFLLAILSLSGACILEFSKTNWDTQLIMPMLVCLISSSVFGYFALYLMKSLTLHLHKFSFYLIPLGLGLLIYSLY